MDKLQVYHFYNGNGGGVWAVIRNLVAFSNDPMIQNHIIHTVNKTVFPEYSTEPVENCSGQQLVFYNKEDNYYHTCRKMASCIPNEKTLIVAHDWNELGMASNLGIQNPLVYVLHGNYAYYYELAKKHEAAIDVFVCISNVIFNELCKLMPHRGKDIFQLNFPVVDIRPGEKPLNQLNIIYYVGDLTDQNKQFSIILKIAEILAEGADKYFFTIIGAGFSEAGFFDIWPVSMRHRVKFMGVQPHAEICRLLATQHLFLLPSINEGMPVSLVESMKAGAVPLVKGWDGSVRHLVKEGVTGFTVPANEPYQYALHIKALENDRELLANLALASTNLANELYDPVANTTKFNQLCAEVTAKAAPAKKAVRVYGSRLDGRLLPNSVTRIIRKSFVKKDIK